jgi:predicted cupin superfamily sugar epimerase
MNYQDIIKKFDLVPLPEEGGYYRETYRDSSKVVDNALPLHDGDRTYSTCIYYLITPEEFSGLHAVKSTEIFHFYAGDPVEMVQITEDNQVTRVILGNDLESNHSPQVIVTPHIWQGTKLVADGEWALLGCTVAPGFEFSDFIIEDRDALIKRFPKHKDAVIEYTR